MRKLLDSFGMRRAERARHSIVAGVIGCCALSACGPRPVELGFWLEPVAFASPRLGEPLSMPEYARIDQVAREEIARAFKDFDVAVTANRNARFKVEVIAKLRDWRLQRPGTYAGESRAVAGFGGSGAVNFEYVANGAMVFAPDDAGRAEIVDALGRGVGRVAIHEFLHQLLPKLAIHDSKDPNSYEGNSPALIEGYFGDLHWDIARPWLDARLKRKS
jgi:hypothetical protein